MEFILRFFGSVVLCTLLTAFFFTVFALIASFFSKSDGGLLLDPIAAMMIFAYLAGKIGAIVGLTSGIVIGILSTGIETSALIGFAVYIVHFYWRIEKQLSGNARFEKFIITVGPAVLSAFSCVLVSLVFNSLMPK